MRATCGRAYQSPRVLTARSLRERQRETERRSTAGSLASGLDVPTVRQDDVLRYREAESGAAARARSIRFVEALEDALKVAALDPDTGVRDAERDVTIVAGSRKSDGAARRRELHRVVNEIRQHLRDALAVGANDRCVAGLHEQRDFGARGERTHPARAVGQQIRGRL